MLETVSNVAPFVAVGAVVLLAATGNLFSSSPFVIAAQLAAFGLAAWARRSFPRGSFRVMADPGAETIIRSGPYRVIRHPMYAAALLFLGAAVAGHLSPLTAATLAVVVTFLAGRVAFEERQLRSRYPDYDAYARETKAIVPYVV